MPSNDRLKCSFCGAVIQFDFLDLNDNNCLGHKYLICPCCGMRNDTHDCDKTHLMNAVKVIYGGTEE